MCLCRLFTAAEVLCVELGIEAIDCSDKLDLTPYIFGLGEFPLRVRGWDLSTGMHTKVGIGALAWQRRGALWRAPEGSPRRQCVVIDVLATAPENGSQLPHAWVLSRCLAHTRLPCPSSLGHPARRSSANFWACSRRARHPPGAELSSRICTASKARDSARCLTGVASSRLILIRGRGVRAGRSSGG